MTVAEAFKDDGNYPTEWMKSLYAAGRNSYSVNVNWWDSCVILGPCEGNPGGNVDVWCAGVDFADAVAAAIRLVEGEGHTVVAVTANL